jgi:hypothetical protein
MSQRYGSDSKGVVDERGGEARGAGVVRLFVCAACREAKPWALSCVHTFTGSGATDLAGAPAFEPPHGHPRGVEWSYRAWREVRGPASQHPTDSCRLTCAEADARALSVVVASAWPIIMSPATLRWLDTKDRRGATNSDPITYGREGLEFLSQNGIGRYGEARAKRREIYGRENVFDDGTIDAGRASKVRHPRWKHRLEQHSSAWPASGLGGPSPMT